MSLLTWTFIVIGIGVSLIAFLFALFQYFNRRGSPKALVVKKSILLGSIILVTLYTFGLVFWVEYRIDSEMFDEVKESKYVGRVIDKDTGQPIRGAKVTFEFQGIPQVVYSDSEGIYIFSIRLTKLNLEGRLRVDAEGYKKFDLFVMWTPDSKVDDIRLQPLNYKTNQHKSPKGSKSNSQLTLLLIKGNVLNKKNLEPIQGVEVSVVGRTEFTYTDSRGYFSLTLGNINQSRLKITIKMANFRTYHRDIEITANQKEINIEVLLEPI